MNSIDSPATSGKIVLPGGNSVELLGTYGGDLTHALSAWTSTARELTEEKEKRIPALLSMLADDQHGTPFEKSTIHFLVKADTASHIHLLKHRAGVSINGESPRYKELKEDKFLVPEDWPPEFAYYIEDYLKDLYKKYHETLEYLEKQLGDRQRAKESARFLLPYANQLYLDVMFNFRSFVHFYFLRSDTTAQKEIRDISNAMLGLIQGTGEFNKSLEAFDLWTNQ